MKRNLLGAAAVILAIGFSAFSKFAITENFLVQDNVNVFIRKSTAPFTCITPATLYCKYEVTSTGKANIPAQATYIASEIQTYLANGWIVVASGATLRLYNK